MDIFIDPRVDRFVATLSEIEKGRVQRYLDLFRVYHFALSVKYMKKITMHIWELRPGDLRILFGRGGIPGTIFIVHGFKKKSQKTPIREIEIAESRLKEYV